MVDRRGEHGLDGSYPRLGLLVQAALEVAAGTVAVWADRRGRPALATASGVAGAGLGAVAVGGLYWTRRGKFEAWRNYSMSLTCAETSTSSTSAVAVARCRCSPPSACPALRALTQGPAAAHAALGHSPRR